MYFGFKTIVALLAVLIALFTNINPQCLDDDDDIHGDQDGEYDGSYDDSSGEGNEIQPAGFAYDPCCSFPCQHGGICLSEGQSYVCDCMDTGYYGKTCQHAHINTMLSNILIPSKEVEHYLVTHCSFLWAIVNRIKFLHQGVMKAVYKFRNDMVRTPSVYMAGQEYVKMGSYYNRSWYAQDLAPVPYNCPKAMGIKGPTTLPPVKEVVEYVMERDEFKPCPYGTNMMFAAYAQHFTHQFFRSDLVNIGMTLGGDGVDVCQIYGFDAHQREVLRSRIDGKLKVSIINGEEFPPLMEDVPGIHMLYPAGKTVEERMKHAKVSDVKPKFALAHPIFASTPFILAISTIWIREHNRICDVLKDAHPSWDDERLYQTAKLIITAEMIKITIEDYVQHLSQYKLDLIYDPALTHKTNIQYHNNIRMEFNLLYHWHALLPDMYKFKGKVYNFTDLVFVSHEMVTNNFDDVIASMMRTPSGQITARNYPKWLGFVAEMGIEWGRKMRLQSFNNYRRFFGMRPYRSFLEFADDPEVASALECLYKDIEAMEFFPAILIEKNTGSVVGPSMVVMGGSWSIKGLIANPVGSPGWWKPSSFGGEVGWNIVQNASLHTLLCQNLKNKCQGMHIGFAVPQKCIREIRKKINKKNKYPY